MNPVATVFHETVPRLLSLILQVSRLVANVQVEVALRLFYRDQATTDSIGCREASASRSPVGSHAVIIVALTGRIVYCPERLGHSADGVAASHV